ncbi:helix-turn-helix domain-containing protein [Streptomyces sp. 205]|uniref:Helix-turn-helix domain-containing protein n=2 Tax=Streptomyces coffeae TaxID=621382 RepID=A0ABS1NCA1_9ACTN|nr:helix-turn-helix domain-containing protein [Streptomyces coffeae]
MAEKAADCPERVAGRLARNFTDLVATLITERAAGDVAGTVGSRDRQTWEVCAYVDRHLGDPGLGPDTIAAAHRMSVRSLHKLFEGEGITVSRLIQRRRLRECARDLAQGDIGERTVSGVARRWGFTNPAHFSRLFRDAYGMSPSQWRDTRAGATDRVRLPLDVEEDDLCHAPRRHEKHDRRPAVTKHSQTVGLTCREAATHGEPAESRDPLGVTHALGRFHADGEREPATGLPPEVLAGPSGAEIFRHRQATPKGAVTSRHGLSPASAGECAQEGA